jgi:aryl-alcohol dehydrogenase-like predicted oxidoreductase
VVRVGKVRYIGASAMFAWQFAKALYTADQNGWARFVSMQSHYNLIYREEEREMLARKPSEPGETARALADVVTKQRYDRADNVSIVHRVSDLAEARGVPMTQVALAWMLAKPLVTAPIIGATKPHHLEDAVAALALRLTPEEVQRLEEAYQPHPVIGFS